MAEPLVIGIDIGTSGARSVALTADGSQAATAHAAIADVELRNPAAWWRAVDETLKSVLLQIVPARVQAIAVDGTSGTCLAISSKGDVLGQPYMYNDQIRDEALLKRIAPLIAPESAAHGATSGLAKALVLQEANGVARVVHQADWIAGCFSGKWHVTDENNALKTGYDPVQRRWPLWMKDTGLSMELLPDVVEPGTVIGRVTPQMAGHFGLSDSTLVVSGTTDGCASFLATGADKPGDGVTALGSTLTLKLLSEHPVFAPQFGIYSHRFGDTWLVGGASNTGGKVLAQHFSKDQLELLTSKVDPTTSSELDYYPLPGPGERFPLSDPKLMPRLEPRPEDDALFLHGILEGIASIEALGYRRLSELRAPPLRSLRSVGGGAKNSVWSAIRQRKLNVPFLPSASEEAAAGTARLALMGARKAGLI